MKTITLTQPWASLVAIGAKRIETRNWGTAYRGPLAIHAAKGLGAVGGHAGLIDLCLNEPFRSALALAGKGRLVPGEDLPLGAVVATCRLVGCIRITAEDNAANLAAFYAHAAAHERAFGDYTLGRYMWLLADVAALPAPVPARGMLGLWEWAPPGGLAI